MMNWNTASSAGLVFGQAKKSQATRPAPSFPGESARWLRRRGMRAGGDDGLRASLLPGGGETASDDVAAAVDPLFVPRGVRDHRNFQRKQNMRLTLTMALVAAAISTVGVAQPANRDANTPAVNAPNAPPNPGAPVAGANSFTEGQAKSRIESNGYANVGELRKDDQGVWRGKAMKDGKSVSVSLDFQGNVTAQ
jgi:hypothetical protein